MSDLRTQIADTLRADLADQLRAAGHDDPTWAGDVCDNAAQSVIGLLTQDFRRLDGQWLTRWVSNWTLDRADRSYCMRCGIPHQTGVCRREDHT
jgi:hypothetical protein